MISVELATALKQAGLVWHPASGDRFTLITGAFDDEVFTLSDMVVEAQQSRTGTVLGFNGTTEWALDSTEITDALWLPGEDQLRGSAGIVVPVAGTHRAGLSSDLRAAGRGRRGRFRVLGCRAVRGLRASPARPDPAGDQLILER